MRSVPAGLINTFGVHLLKYLNNISVWWHAVGTTSLVIAILAKAPTHQSRSFVFATFIDQTGVDGVGWGVSEYCFSNIAIAKNIHLLYTV